MKQNLRLLSVGFFVLIVSVMFAMTALAGDEVKITGKIVAAPADPSGTLAPIAIECKDGQYALVNNVPGKKMVQFVGSDVKVTGVVKEVDGKKVMTAWVFERQGAKKKIPQPN
ncbi:MAG: hypothetical protein QME06_04775 [Desulfobacterales bacterium]|nr:hypothetical protein [Desulfobacterales bacterium]